MGRDWFAALDEAVLAAPGVDLQLCMMQPAQALQATTMRSVTNGRATQDHTDRSVAEGLPLGHSSLVLHSLGVWPSRDNVWTNSSVYAGPGKFLMREQMPVLQTAMAVLSGGPYGVGKRISIKYSRAMVTAALTGKFDLIKFRHDDTFNLDVPTECPGVPSDVLDPKNTWIDKDSYDLSAKKLAQMFGENFTKFKDASPEIKNAGPQIQ